MHFSKKKILTFLLFFKTLYVRKMCCYLPKNCASLKHFKKNFLYLPKTTSFLSTPYLSAMRSATAEAPRKSVFQL